MSTSLHTRTRRQLLFPSATPTVPPGTAMPTVPPTPAVPPAPAQTPAEPVVLEPQEVQGVPSAADHHLLSRFSWGITPSLAAESAAAGGGEAWFERQLDPDSIPDPDVAELDDWFPNVALSPEEKADLNHAQERSGAEQDSDFARWALHRRLRSKRQLLEVMTDAWSNLLHVTAPSIKTYPHRADYDRTIRANALGRFEDLLAAAIFHPAMLCYLDNAKSTKRAPNENLGRELLELHTVGRASGYTEDDVLNSTRILTGFRVYSTGTNEAYYAPEDHWIGQVDVLDFSSPNTDPDGKAMGEAYVAYLANNPATALKVARFLCVRFVSDAPSDALVESIAGVFTDSGTSIKETLRALIAHPEFAAARGLKVRTPVEDFVATFRAMQVDILPPQSTSLDEAAYAVLRVCTSMAQRPFDWPRPDGFPEQGETWSSASRMLNCWKIHKNTLSGAVIGLGVEFKPDSYWQPEVLPIRFDALVDSLSRIILGRPADDRLLQVASEATGDALDEIITGLSGLLRFRFRVLLLALLDTPYHMTR